MKNLLPILLFIIVSSCHPDESDEAMNGISFDGSGYRPIYTSSQEMQTVEIQSASELTQPGKIYQLDPYLFVNESGKGIHIIDNTNPKNPVNLSFISILGNYDIAAKGNFLYADNVSDLLVFDISDPKAPKLTRRIAEAIPVNSFPPYRNIYFECPQPEKGIVVGWEKVPMASRPKCYR